MLKNYRLAPLTFFKNFRWIKSLPYPNLNTSLMAFYSQPGTISAMAAEYFEKFEDLERNFKTMHDELLKFPYEQFWRQNSTSEDYLILSFSTEFYTKFDNRKECITLLPQFGFGQDTPWHNILNQNKFHIEFDDEKSLGLNRELVVDFARLVSDIFKDRVILVDTHLTDRVIVKNKISDKPVNFTNIPNYQNLKFSHDPKNREYGNRLVKILLREFKRKHGSDIPIVSIPNEFVYRDVDHKWGSNPFHLHQSSTNLIGLKIYEQIERHRKKIRKVNNEICIL